jgi:predicted DsbA family dithiol-disulfide isomerase
LVQRAGKLGLDEPSFRSCLTSGKYKAQIQQDVQAGTAVGVNATPSFFINGAFLSGSQPEIEFEKIINTELASLARPHPAGPGWP